MRGIVYLKLGLGRATPQAMVSVRLHALPHPLPPAGGERLDARAGFYQNPFFSVTNHWRGAPASSVWLSPLAVKPLVPMVEI